MSDTMRHIIEIFAVIVFALTIVGWIKRGVDSSETTVNSAINKMTNFGVRLEESEYTKYDGVVVKGSAVISFIKDQIAENAEICIKVITPKSTTSYIYTDGTLTTESTALISSALSKKNAAHIELTGDFLGEVIRDASNTITIMTFTQQ